MPAAVVQQATTRKQRVISGSLQTLPTLAKAAAIKAPALIIVGEVVKLRRKLEWFAPQGEAAEQIAPGQITAVRTDAAQRVMKISK